MTDTLTRIRELGENLLDNIAEQAKSDDEKISSAAPRAFYSVSKVLLDVIELDVKAGRASKQEIASKLAQFRLLDKGKDAELYDLLAQAARKQAQIQQRQAQFATIQPSDIKELIDILAKIIAIVVGAVSAYKAVRDARSKKQSDRAKDAKTSLPVAKNGRVEDTKPSRKTSKRKRAGK